MEVYEAYKTYLKQRFEKATYYQYVSHLKPLFTYLKEQHLSPITLHSFEGQEWVNTLIKQELQPANINAKITASKHFFNFLVEQKYRQQNPFQEVTLVRGLKKEANYIDLKPIEAFLAQQHPNSEDYKAFLYHSIVISIVTMGVHIQDLIALKLKHINLEEKTLCPQKFTFFDWLFIRNEEKYIWLHLRKLSCLLILCLVNFLSMYPDHYQSDEIFCADVLQKVLIKR